MTQRLEWDADRDSAQRAARVVGLRALDDVADARVHLRKRDPESVHRFRIALRRLRSWLRIYRPVLDDTVTRRSHRRLHRLARATTRLRDIDVQMHWLNAERDALGESRLEASKWIGLSLKSDRKRAWRRFGRILEREFPKAERVLRRQLTQYIVKRDVRTNDSAAGIRTVAAEALRQQADALGSAFDRIRSADDTKRLHRARIIAKRTRYALEAIAEKAPAAAGVASDLHRFQDIVGELRDAQLLAHRVTREVTSIAAERTALVASELVYRPTGPMDFSRVTADTPFDASLSLLFARLRDRISAASRAVSASLEPASEQRLIRGLEMISGTFGEA
jgi:CHAD domain-containing protein